MRQVASNWQAVLYQSFSYLPARFVTSISTVIHACCLSLLVVDYVFMLHSSKNNGAKELIKRLSNQSTP